MYASGAFWQQGSDVCQWRLAQLSWKKKKKKALVKVVQVVRQACGTIQQKAILKRGGARRQPKAACTDAPCPGQFNVKEKTGERVKGLPAAGTRAAGSTTRKNIQAGVDADAAQETQAAMQQMCAEFEDEGIGMKG